MKDANRKQTWQMIVFVCFLAGIALLLLSLTACDAGGVGTQYTPKETAYLADIRPSLSTLADSQGEAKQLIKLGQSVCKAIDEGMTPESILRSLEISYTSDQADVLYMSAQKNLCP